MVVIPTKDGDIRIAATYHKLNAISSLGQLPTLCIDEVLDFLENDAVFAVRPLVFVLPNHHRQGHHPPQRVLHAHSTV